MNIADMITAKIIARLDEGEIPWRRTWTSGIPCNGFTNNCYHGINALMTSGYANPRFYSFLQVKQLGESVKLGSKGTPIVFWKFDDKVEIEDDREKRRIPLMRYYTVFNEEQTTIKPPEYTRINDPIELCGRLVEEYKGMPAIMYGKPAYAPTPDIITMPNISDFIDSEAYYATLFHEISHSTGHKDRLNRNMIGSMKTEAYAEEELIAEFSASILCALTGIRQIELEDNTVAYIQSWKKRLQDNKSLIIHLASAGQKSANYVKGETCTQ